MYLNLIQVADSFGVTERVVRDWVRHDGMPHVLDRGSLLFDRAQVAGWAADRGLTTRSGFLAPERAAFAAGLELAPLLRSGGIWRDVAPAEVPARMEQVLAAQTGVAPAIVELLVQRLRSGSGLTWAPVGGGFALPHFSSHPTLGHGRGLLALILLREGLPLAEPPADRVPVTRLLFFVPASPRAHLDTLGRLGQALLAGPLRERIASGAGDGEIHAALAAADAAVAAGPARRAP